MYHPANVYPVLLGVGSVPYVSSYVTVFVAGVTSQLFASKLTV